MQHLLPLDLLAAGEEGCLVEIDGRPELVSRLAEMGLREGVRLKMVLPGKPCIIALGNHRFSFRAEEAGSILVEVSAVAPLRSL